VFTSVFALTALPFGVTWGMIYGDAPKGMVAGFFFGLLMGLAMIPFLRLHRQVLRTPDRTAFEKKLKIEMSALGYAPTVIDDDFVQYRAPKMGVWEFGPIKAMSGESMTRVSVHFDGTSTTMLGPRWMVRKIVSRL
jgi:hypothetical protein